MKSIITIALVALCLSVKAQSFEISGKPIEYSNILKLDSASTKDQLYSNGLSWFATTFKDSKSVVQLQDKENGLIVGRAVTAMLVGSNVEYINYTIKLYFKQGKIKYELSDFENSGYGLIKDGEVVKTSWMAKGIVKKQYAALQKKCNDEISIIGQSITNNFNKPKTQDW